MATMNISLPDKMKEWIEAQVATGRFSNASDYVRHLVRRHQERKSYIDYIQNAVDEGIASGISERGMEDIMKAVRADMQKVDSELKQT